MCKFIIRKPLFPVLFLILLVVEVTFSGILRRGIARDIQTIDDMYNNSQITFYVLPEVAGDLELRPRFVDMISDVEEIDRICSYMSCPYALREPEKVVGMSWLYGTTDPLWFADKMWISYEFMDGYAPSEDGEVKDWNTFTSDIPCIVDEEFLTKEGLKTGNRFTAAAYSFVGEDREKSPDINMHIIGTFDNREEKLERYAVIIPEFVFLEPPEILCTTALLEKCCAFKQCEIMIKKEFNRQADEVEDKMLEVFDRAGVLVHSDARVLKKAVHSIEQRLKIQKALEKPIEITLCVAVALLALLMALSVQEDIFLYLLHGVSRMKTFMKFLLALGVIIICSALLAIVCAFIVLGTEWIGWITLYAGINVLVSIVTVSVPLLIFSNKNLVNFYQTKEA